MSALELLIIADPFRLGPPYNIMLTAKGTEPGVTLVGISPRRNCSPRLSESFRERGLCGERHGEWCARTLGPRIEVVGYRRGGEAYEVGLEFREVDRAVLSKVPVKDPS